MRENEITILVKHYLTPQGMQYFEKSWFPEVYSVISRQEGFITITYQIEQDCAHINLQFKNEETLNHWVEHPRHDSLINALETYRSRDYWEAVLTRSCDMDVSKLEWEIYK